MLTTTSIPIARNWTSSESGEVTASAKEVNALLAQLAIDDLSQSLIPYLAAAAAELALVANISWPLSVDDAPVLLVRLIAKVAIAAPHAGGVHTGRLLAELLTPFVGS